jgi:hypothetical protein
VDVLFLSLRNFLPGHTIKEEKSRWEIIMDELTQFRKEIDQFMQFHRNRRWTMRSGKRLTVSHITTSNEALVMVLPVERYAASEPMVEMETSTGDKRRIAAGAALLFL